MQRDLRAMEARLVAEKSAKIRDWVARKIQEVSKSVAIHHLSIDHITFMRLVQLNVPVISV
jgi:hypothetical protein